MAFQITEDAKAAFDARARMSVTSHAESAYHFLMVRGLKRSQQGMIEPIEEGYAFHSINEAVVILDSEGQPIGLMTSDDWTLKLMGVSVS